MRNFPRPNFSSNTPKFINPNFERSEAFGKYCYLYDPLVSIDSATKFDCFSSEIMKKWHWEGFRLLDENCVHESKLLYYYSCVAPYRQRITSSRAIKLVESYQRKQSSQEIQNNKFNHDKLLKDLSRELNQSILLKQYIYYECEDKKGWMIILRTQNINDESDYLVKGIGETLQEASIDFVNNQASRFTVEDSSVNIFLNNKIPLTTQDMFSYCSRFDTEIDPSSSRFIKPYQYLASTIPDNYSLKCQSSKTVFFMEVEHGNVMWTVKKFLKLENESHLIGGKLSVETSDFDLQEAFRDCEEQINHIQNNPEALAQAIDDLEQKSLAKEMEYNFGEGQAFFDSTISEYGEDVFPDR
jgi:hypothetical protein